MDHEDTKPQSGETATKSLSREAAEELSHGRQAVVGNCLASEPRSGGRIFRRYAAYAPGIENHGLAAVATI